MSRHFTYEIDERNLRVKLKDIEAPFKESAWEKFEAYTATQHKRTADSGFSGVKFSLNRNVVMLAVFAVVIISFSLLLFNFISIKNPKKESAANLEENKPVTEEKMTEAKPAAPVVSAKIVATPTVAAISATVAVKKESMPEVKPVAPEPAPVVKKTAAPPVAEKVKDVPNITQKSSDDEEAALEAAEKKAEALRIKQEKRAAAALAKKIKPAVVTEDTDPDVKPQ